MKMHTNPQVQQVWRTAVSGFHAREHETSRAFRRRALRLNLGVIPCCLSLSEVPAAVLCRLGHIRVTRNG